jgi:hypothetical protein
MSFLDADTSNAQEPVCVPANKEYKIRIIGYKSVVDETSGEEVYVRANANGNPYFMPIFEIPDVATSKEFSAYIPLPTGEMSAKEKNRTEWDLECFKQCFNIGPKSPDQTDKQFLQKTIGKTGWAILSVEESEGYGKQNKIKEYIRPK